MKKFFLFLFVTQVLFYLAGLFTGYVFPEEDIIHQVLPIIAMAESTNRAWVTGKNGEAGKYQIPIIYYSIHCAYLSNEMDRASVS